MKILIALIIGSAIGGMWIQYRFTGGIWTNEVKSELREVVVKYEDLDYWDRPENLAEKEKIHAEFEANKAKWLAENPPVKRLFDGNKIYDNNYVIEYLKENKIGGHCALVWRPDVVC